MQKNRHFFENNFINFTLLIIFLGLILRIFSSLYFYTNAMNTGHGPASLDALRYHLVALEIYNMSFTYEYLFKTKILPQMGYTYSILLGYLYKIFYPSILVGYYFSIFVWFMSCFVIWAIAKELNIKKIYIMMLIFLYSFIPSSIFLSSVTLKEIYQVLFYSFSIYFFIRLHKELGLNNFLMFLFSLILLAITHRYMFVLSFLFLYLFFFSTIKIKIYEKSFLFFTLLILSLLLLFTNLYLDFNLVYEIDAFRSNHRIGRATYDFSLIKNIPMEQIAFIAEMFLTLVYYFFKPFIFDIQNSADFLIFFENMLRVYIIIHALFLIFKSFTKKKENNISITIFCIALLTELFWAIGTVNYGTAARHHFVAFPIIFVSYFSLLTNEQ